MIKKILKKSWILILTCLFGYIFLFWIIGNDVHAQEVNTSTAWTADFSKKAGEWSELGEKLSQVATLALWPFVTVAGIAMDNQMVYWATFGFDSALWRIWNIAKNIANFMLGFLFVYSLFTIIVKGKTEEIKKTIQNTLIAGILIQASRFITAAAVDLSTIATYAIGGMPLSVMGESEQSSKYILWSKIFIATDDNKKENIIIIKTTQQATQQEGEGRNISPCKIFPYTPTNGEKEILIMGREYVYYETKEKGYPTSEGVCHYQGKVYRFNENPEFLKGLEGIKSDTSGNLTLMQSGQAEYIKNTKFPEGTGIQKLIDQGSILQKDDPCNTSVSSFTWPPKKEQTDATFIGFDNRNERIGKKWWAIEINDLFEESKSYVGVFSTLYSTLLDSAGIGLTEGWTQSIYLTLLNTVLNIAYLAALLLPLTAMVVVLIMRVVMLWAIIALSPIIVIMKVFGWEKKMSGSLEMFKLENIISLLLAPVLISFAVSLSTMFIIILKTGINTDFCNLQGGDGNILGLFNITIEGVGANLSQLIISVLWIAIVWFLLFWAVKQSSIGKKVGASLQKMGEGVIGNIPIIPVAGGGIGLNQLDPSNINGLAGKLNTKIESNLRESSNKNIAGLLQGTALEWMYSNEINAMEKQKNDIAKNLDDNQINSYINSLTSWETSKQYKVTYKEGDKEKEETLELTNLLSNDKIVREIVKKQEITGDIRNKAEETLINLIKNATDKKRLEELLESAKGNENIYEKIKTTKWPIGDETLIIDDKLNLIKDTSS